MAMKETVGSLKAYFILVGVVSGLVATSAFWGAALLPRPFAIALFVVSVIGIGFAIAYMYVGISLRTLLVRAPGKIVALLFTSMAFDLLSFLITLAYVWHPQSAVRLVLSMLITWYLWSNVRRLSAAAVASAS